ncbi:MAG: YicC family protein [Chlamydiales bacterium]|nr:YicC family protein [Chlamydiia bacterium]MCP5504834.1 YicC family protein [Chlamydiales bacterium]
MARSMTAYGRAHVKTNAGLFLIEIHSVNRKSLDINTNLPKEFLVLDMGLRSRLADVVKRGYITVRMTKEAGNTPMLEIPSIETLKKFHAEWETCAKELGYNSKEAIPFSTIMQFALGTTSSASAPDETLKKQLFQGFDEAISAFMEMKETEGHALVADILPRLNEIEKDIEKVKKLSKLAPRRYHDRLAKKLEELKINHETDEDRLTREIVLFTDKIDITEEITRLSSHVQQFEGILKEDKARVGRELDFLTQEMNREVNTIAAKSQELEITQAILGVKSELEKIREQLANIE